MSVTTCLEPVTGLPATVRYGQDFYVVLSGRPVVEQVGITV